MGRCPRQLRRTSRQGSQRRCPLSWGARVERKPRGGSHASKHLRETPAASAGGTGHPWVPALSLPSPRTSLKSWKRETRLPLFSFFFGGGGGMGGWGGGLVATAVSLSGCRLSQTGEPPRPAAARPGAAAPTVRSARAQVGRGKRRRPRERGSQSAWAGADSADGEAPERQQRYLRHGKALRRGKPLPLSSAVGRTSGYDGKRSQSPRPRQRAAGRGGLAVAPLGKGWSCFPSLR